MLPSLLPPILKKRPGFSILGFLIGLALSSIVGAALYLLLTTPVVSICGRHFSYRRGDCTRGLSRPSRRVCHVNCPGL